MIYPAFTAEQERDRLKELRATVISTYGDRKSHRSLRQNSLPPVLIPIRGALLKKSWSAGLKSTSPPGLVSRGIENNSCI